MPFPPWPVDVLAQQIVASCAQEEWAEDDLYTLARRAYPYRELPARQVRPSRRNAVRRVRPPARTERRVPAPRPGERHGERTARRPAGRHDQRGAIPENADYDVIAEPEDTFVGTVNEDFAIESLKGDVFLLGNTAWKIRRVESGKRAGGRRPRPAPHHTRSGWERRRAARRNCPTR